MVNVFFNCNLVDPWLSIAQSVPDLNVVYWTAFKRDPKLQMLKDALAETCYIQYWEDAWHGNGYPEDLVPEPLDHNILDLYAKYEIKALQMMDRLDPDRHSFSLLERRRYFRHLLSSSLAVVKKFNIQLVLSPSVPHRVHDYVLYAVCQVQRIPFIMFQQVAFKSRSFIIDHIDGIPDYLKDFKMSSSGFQSELLPEIAAKVSELSETTSYVAPDYMVKQSLAMSKNTGLSGKLRKFQELKNKMLHKSIKPAKTKIKDFSIRTQYFSNKINTILHLKREFAINYLNKDYQKWVAKRPMRDRPYVLVALHYQPEETTSPSAGVYADQTFIVEMLNHSLDAGIDIVVKEHKSQFNNYGPWKAERGRLPEDYNHLARISERVRFVSENQDPFKLIDNASAIATATGTIGYESALRGTPAMVFGRAWFEGMPRVYKIHSFSDIKTYWPDILREKAANRKDNILRYHHNLQKYLIFASHYRETNSKPAVSTDESVKNLILGLANFGNKATNDGVKAALSPFNKVI